MVVICAALLGCAGGKGSADRAPLAPMRAAELLARAAPAHCHAAQLQRLVGQNFARLAQENLGGPLRVIWPHQPVAMDHSAARLNAVVREDGTIKRLFCG